MSNFDLIRTMKKVHNLNMDGKWDEMKKLGGGTDALDFALATRVLAPSEIRNLVDIMEEEKNSAIARLKETNADFSDENARKTTFDRLVKKSEREYKSMFKQGCIRSIMGTIFTLPAAVAIFFLSFHSWLDGTTIGILLFMTTCVISGIAITNIYAINWYKRMISGIPERAEKQATMDYNILLDKRTRDLETCKEIDKYLKMIKNHT